MSNWTSPIRAGYIVLLSSYDSAIQNIQNLKNANAEAFWNPSGKWDWSHIYGLGSWDVTIPGGGAAVITIKLSYQSWNSYDDPGEYNFNFGGYGNTGTLFNPPIPDTGSSWVTETISGTPAYFGLTATEINNLVSNSTSYGIRFDMENYGVNYPDYNIRNVTLEFEYIDLPSGGILLAK